MALLGIEIGNSSIKIVEIDKKGNDFILNNWALVDLPLDLRDKHPEREVFQAEAIKKFITNASTRDSVIVVGGLDVVSKIITLPSLGDDEAAEAIKWQMKDEIPFKIEEGYFSFYKIPQNQLNKEKNQHCYMVVVAKQDIVLKALQTAGLAGIKAVSVIPTSEALFHTFESEITQEGVICLLRMGKFLSSISFYENGNLQLSRDIPIGSDDITNAMTSILVSEEGRLELDYEQAEKIRTEYGVPVDLEKYPKLEHIPIAHLQAVVRPALERIEEEIIRTLEYFRNNMSDTAIRKLIFTGSASQTPHLAEALTNSIGIQCESIDPFAKIKIKDGIHQPEKLQKQKAYFGTAVGAVFAGKTKINLIPEEYRDRWKVVMRKYVSPPYIGALIGIILLLFWGVLMLNTQMYANKKAGLKKELATVEPRVKQLEALVKTHREAEGLRTVFSSALTKRVSISQMLAELSSVVPSSVLLEQIDYSPSSEAVSLKGLAFEQGGAAEKVLSKLVNNLASSPLFKEVELKQAGLGLEYSPKNFKFEIKTEIKKK
ncbi:MAG: type IV pilus assembly protein PilM [Candidatus Saganbacteria bacterium]|nr:type IV pilus assembly protein PilM [Candidatus Saganbacteria bacterium]